ncbi:ATP-dependent zinc metalloprotease ftsh mitochondrial-like [Trifolium pratense]|uniref:ATP-dependent zinc metalloprotease ftsh mitochondrial-like n=1 Tax=Trifolium pratense TaxID=57577 RepID=A0A2K3LVV1_TRIPR|nr:ATP-dependent zinc metalloprotease ftsh mitochondrial-like [Trifolium pratense]
MSLFNNGLFNHCIVVPYPDLGRNQILESHLSKVLRADDVDSLILARRTLGFAAVDIAHVVNNAVIKVLADGGTKIDMTALEYGLMRRQRLISNKKEEKVVVLHLDLVKFIRMNE